jgi:hypothetical protein
VEEHYKHSCVSLHNTENNFYKSTTSIRTSLYMHSHVSLHNTENNFYRASAEGRLGGGSDAPYACSARLGPAYVSIRQHTSAYVSRRKRCALRLQRPPRPCIRQHTSAYASIRQHTSAGASDAPYACSARLGPAYVSIRQHTSLRPWTQLLRQYLYFCTSKTSKLRQY